MKKALIVTIFGFENFGNRLQNYAVHSILSRIGFDVYTFGKYPVKKNLFQRFIYYTKGITKEVLFKAKLFTNKYTYNSKWFLEKDRVNKFCEFNKKFLNVDNKTSLTSLNEKYDYFILGSDQVWNPNWITKKNKSIYDLSFCDRQKRICLSPSFGIECMPEQFENYFINTFSNFDFLSVREQEGLELIQKYSDKNVEVLVDPSMMLTKEEWSLVAKKPKNIETNKPYILCYFIGDFSPLCKVFVKNIADKTNYKVINIFANKDSDYYYCGPSEFLYLIKEASLVITDSFHGSVFSVIFDKPFVVFDRDDGNGNIMNSRIKTLLNKFSLTSKSFKCLNENNLFDNDYSEAKKIISKEQDKLLSYLTKCINPK